MIKYGKEIEALIVLLDDSDHLVVDPVIDRLIEMGESAVNVLEKAWEISMNTQLQERIENVILLIQRDIVSKYIRGWVDFKGEELLDGAYFIAKAQYPSLDYSVLNEKIEKLKSEIWLELNAHLTALEKVKLINHFLYSVHGFNRSFRSSNTPQLFFINHVLDTHKGNPITLAIIYAEIAARLELPIYCVDLPRNFLLCYQDPTYLDDPDGILFYINPFTRGSVISRGELELFLTEQKIAHKPEYFRPCTNVETIIRLSEGLRYAYASSRMEDKAGFIEDIILKLKKGPSDQIL